MAVPDEQVSMPGESRTIDGASAVEYPGSEWCIVINNDRIDGTAVTSIGKTVANYILEDVVRPDVREGERGMDLPEPLPDSGGDLIRIRHLGVVVQQEHLAAVLCRRQRAQGIGVGRQAGDAVRVTRALAKFRRPPNVPNETARLGFRGGFPPRGARFCLAGHKEWRSPRR